MFGHLEARVGRCWGIRVSVSLLGHVGAILKLCPAHAGPFRGYVGPMLGHLEAMLGHKGEKVRIIIQ